MDLNLPRLAKHVRRLIVHTVEQLRSSASSAQHARMNKKEQRLQADATAGLGLLRSLLQLLALEPSFAYHHESKEGAIVFDAEPTDNHW